MNTYLKVELCDQNIDHDFLPDLFFATSSQCCSLIPCCRNFQSVISQFTLLSSCHHVVKPQQQENSRNISIAPDQHTVERSPGPPNTEFYRLETQLKVKPALLSQNKRVSRLSLCSSVTNLSGFMVGQIMLSPRSLFFTGSALSQLTQLRPVSGAIRSSQFFFSPRLF